MRLSIIFSIGLFIISCNSANDFQSNCMSAAKIIRKAEEHLKTIKVEEVLEGGKPVAIRVTKDNSESREYLESKSKVLQKNYDAIKGYYLRNGADSYDALCAMAILNEFKFHQDGYAIEERCIYTKLVIDGQSEMIPSDWFLDKFYRYLTRFPGEDNSKWVKLSSREKFEEMIRGLLVPGKDGKNCINKET